MKKILYVEDDEVLAESIIDSFDYHCPDCFKIEHYVLGEEALKYLKNNSVDMVLLDYNLPGDKIKTGKDFLEQLRKDDTNFNLPVVIHTVLTDKTLETLLILKYDALDFITKATEDRVLIKKIQLILKTKESSGDLDPFELNEELFKISFKGKRLELTHFQFLILRKLYKGQAKVHSIQSLLETIYPSDDNIEKMKNEYAGRIASHIKNIRNEIKKIDPDFKGIVTYSKQGYRLYAKQIKNR